MLSENAYFVWEWNILAHVCRYWRQVLFASPRRLGLQLRCTPVTPVREMLDIWPTLPIHIQKPAYLQFHPEADYDNVIVALEHHDLVSVINIDALTRHQLGKVVAVMQKPFPALTHLHLRSTDEAAQALPDTFMSGSAPRLRVLRLEGISFPTLPSLILSPTELTTLNLYAIPSGGYILPGEMVTFLSPFTRLEDLVIEFKSPSPPPDPTSRLVTPSIRALLPALKYFRFKGISEYLEDIATQIDAPLLSNFGATIFNQAIFAIPRLSRFIQRTETLFSLDQMELSFESRNVRIKFSHRDHDDHHLSLHVPCSPSDWQLSSIVQLCGPPLLLPPCIERLDVYENTLCPQKWEYDIDQEQWLDILQSFTSVRELYVSDTMWPLLAPTLQQHTGENTLNVLPMLCDLFLEQSEPSGPFPETIQPFIAARELAGHPVVVHHQEGGDWRAIG